MALATGEHVVLATPTGSGKSLAALAGIALARNRGEKAVWTAPIKALVAEKFFELAALAGCRQRGSRHRRRRHQLRRADPGLHGRGVRQSDAGRRRSRSRRRRHRLRLSRRVPLLRRQRSGVGLAGATAHRPPLPVPADVGDPRRHDRDLSRSRAPQRASGQRDHLGDAADPALPRVADDLGRRLGHRGDRARASARCTWCTPPRPPPPSGPTPSSVCRSPPAPNATPSRRPSPRSSSPLVSARRCSECCATVSASITPACSPATDASSRSWPATGCCRSSAAPTPWAWASTSRSAQCCSPRSPSSTASEYERSTPASSTSWPGGLDGLDSIPTGTSGPRRPIT